jgi:hypothetical protein
MVKGRSVHFSAASDEWATPHEVYAGLDAEFHFTLDLCPLGGTVDGTSMFMNWGGRLKFGGAKNSAPFPSIVVVFAR